MKIVEGGALTFRPSEYDSVILNQISERNPQLTSPSDLLRVAIRVYDLESNDTNSKSKRLDRIEERLEKMEERLLALESKVELLIKLIQDGR